MGFDVRIVPGVLAGWLVTAPAVAQTWESAEPKEPAAAAGQTAPQTARPAEPSEGAEPAASDTDAGAPVEPEFSSASSCFPACRSGFVCAEGSCVSACNPACADGETCTPAGECTRPGAAETASAAAPPQQDSQEEDRPRGRRHGVRTHDGFYLRLGLGFGGLGMNLDVDDQGRPGSAKASGPALLTEIALGGTLGESLVLGFGVFTSDVSNNRALTLRMEGANPYSVNARVDELSAGVVGPFLDYYFDPHRGLHLQGAVGIGVTSFERQSDREQVLLGGLGVMLGVGHEWWVGEQWSLGVLARVLWTGVGGEDPVSSDLTYSGSAFVPGLLMTATYH